MTSMFGPSYLDEEPLPPAMTLPNTQRSLAERGGVQIATLLVLWSLILNEMVEAVWTVLVQGWLRALLLRDWDGRRREKGKMTLHLKADMEERKTVKGEKDSRMRADRKDSLVPLSSSSNPQSPTESPVRCPEPVEPASPKESFSSKEEASTEAEVTYLGERESMPSVKDTVKSQSLKKVTFAEVHSLHEIEAVDESCRPFLYYTERELDELAAFDSGSEEEEEEEFSSSLLNESTLADKDHQCDVSRNSTVSLVLGLADEHSRESEFWQSVKGAMECDEECDFDDFPLPEDWVGNEGEQASGEGEGETERGSLLEGLPFESSRMSYRASQIEIPDFTVPDFSLPVCGEGDEEEDEEMEEEPVREEKTTKSYQPAFRDLQEKEEEDEPTQGFVPAAHYTSDLSPLDAAEMTAMLAVMQVNS